MPTRFEQLAPDVERALEGRSAERFDRVAFALRALAAMQPPGTTVAVREGRRLSIEEGRAWGRAPGERWIVLSVSPTASRRAIALAVAGLGGARTGSFSLDLLLYEP
jgi:hypothetical protein